MPIVIRPTMRKMTETRIAQYLSFDLLLGSSFNVYLTALVPGELSSGSSACEVKSLVAGLLQLDIVNFNIFFLILIDINSFEKI